MSSSAHSSPSSASPVPLPVVFGPARGGPVHICGIHPAATLFPMTHGKELGQLADDIGANGLREEIVLYQGLILDGRNRHRACELSGVEPRFVEWDGQGSPLAFVLSPEPAPPPSRREPAGRDWRAGQGNVQRRGFRTPTAPPIR